MQQNVQIVCVRSAAKRKGESIPEQKP